ncbi:MAG TPA: hypothetical protein ENI74_08520 [Gammaproteobacteria bacterium]|nr:hypothetical protein [Gammaproteobacteria bacterium]
MRLRKPFLTLLILIIGHLFSQAASARFVSEDPLGFAAGDVNFYAYVNNNPVNFNDPSGNCPSCIGAGTSVLLGGAIRFFTPGAKVFDPGAIALDAALGAVGAGFANKFNTARQLARVNSAPVPGKVLGEIGENLAGISSLGKTRITINGRFRFPDQRVGFNITEVKNTTALSSRDIAQIRDFADFADLGNGAVRVLTRGGATNTSRAQGLIDDGLVSIGKIPGINSSGVANLSTGTSSLFGFGAGTASNAAGGGFVLYPSKPNTNMMQSVYAK